MQTKEKLPINVLPVVLCGGSGARLWPLSRAGFPKQFLTLLGTASLFQNAVEHVNSIASDKISLEKTIVVTGEEHRFIAQNQLREIPSVSSELILEPEGKNTAPALTLAALKTIKDGNDPVLLVTPADQIVKDSQVFIDVIQKAIKIADSGAIVILGIKPASPETGFGYIQQEGVAGNFSEYNVAAFVEKPNREVAESYLSSGSYTWNSGIFVVRASIWISALKTFRRDIFDAVEASFLNATRDEQFIRPNEDLFRKVPSESVDYAVMEKCPRSVFDIKVIPLDAGWSDLGAWDAVWHAGEKDQDGNLILGDVLMRESKDNLIHASHRLVTALGVNNLVIVETADAVLVADRIQSQNVKKIVNTLSIQRRDEPVLHRKVSRPWGWYDTIDVGERFKVKRIQVNPGAQLSLQKHQKRAEHWVVVKGMAKVTCGEKTIILKENESTYIPLGSSHCLANPGKDILEIIEVQSGEYLEEDDIVRISDSYGR